MRGSSFTTFLVFLPLVAIPVLAVFGIPEFQPAVASRPTEAPGNGIADLKDPVVHSPEGHNQAAPKNGDLDLFKKAPADTTNPPAIEPIGTTDPFNTGNAGNDAKSGTQRNTRLNGWQVDPRRYLDPKPEARLPEPIKTTPKQPDHLERHRQKAAPFPGMASTKAASLPTPTMKRLNGTPARRLAARTATPPKSVQEAIDRLRRLGITRYAIGQSDKAGVYYFRCYAPSKVNPRVSRLLEVEDDSLLQAACKVVARVESRTVVN